MIRKIWKSTWLLLLTITLAASAGLAFLGIREQVELTYHPPTPYSEWFEIPLPATYEVVDKVGRDEKLKELEYALTDVPHVKSREFQVLTDCAGWKHLLYFNNEIVFGGGVLYFYGIKDGRMIQTSYQTYYRPRPNSYHIKPWAYIHDGQVRVDWISQNMSEKDKLKMATIPSLVLAFACSLLAFVAYCLLLSWWNPFNWWSPFKKRRKLES